MMMAYQLWSDFILLVIYTGPRALKELRPVVPHLGKNLVFPPKSHRLVLQEYWLKSLQNFRKIHDIPEKLKNGVFR